jgi:biopolymer transport protein ExbD
MSEVVTGKKGAPLIDMTPMVDLGFLLIAFFMLATTLAKPKAIEVIKPAKKPLDLIDQIKVNKKRVLSILLGENNKAYFYQIAEEELAAGGLKVDSADFSSKGVRNAIMERRKAVGEVPGLTPDSIIVLIKGAPKAKFKNMVDIMDEMRITNSRYALVDRDKIDTVILEQLGLIKK